MTEVLPTMPQSGSKEGPLPVFGCVRPQATSVSVRAQGVVDALFGGEAAQHRGAERLCPVAS